MFSVCLKKTTVQFPLLFSKLAFKSPLTHIDVSGQSVKPHRQAANSSAVQLVLKCVLNLNCSKCWKKRREKNLVKGLTPAKKKKSEFVFENVLITDD